jgi:hypothetical protein
MTQTAFFTRAATARKDPPRRVVSLSRLQHSYHNREIRDATSSARFAVNASTEVTWTPVVDHPRCSLVFHALCNTFTRNQSAINMSCPKQNSASQAMLHSPQSTPCPRPSLPMHWSVFGSLYSTSRHRILTYVGWVLRNRLSPSNTVGTSHAIQAAVVASHSPRRLHRWRIT